MSNTNVEEQKVEKEVVSINKLLEAGVYFGHKKDRWNPKMKPFIHGVKNGTHIINVSKTHKALELAFKLISKAAERRKKMSAEETLILKVLLRESLPPVFVAVLSPRQYCKQFHLRFCGTVSEIYHSVK